MGKIKLDDLIGFNPIIDHPYPNSLSDLSDISDTTDALENKMSDNASNNAAKTMSEM